MLEVVGVSVAFGATRVLDRVDLVVPTGDILALLGPSGSGKTTLLRVIAGLQQPDQGTVCWDGADLRAVPAHRRGFGYVFQDEQLFPHRSVGQNVAFGLKMQHRSKAAQAARVERLLAMVGLAGFEGRSVTNLSGGEAKRVALARALAPEPRLLLLDEPLTGLDRRLHDRLAADVRQLLTALGTTALLVTHDHDEAATIADRTVEWTDVRHPTAPSGGPDHPHTVGRA